MSVHPSVRKTLGLFYILCEFFKIHIYMGKTWKHNWTIYFLVRYIRTCNSFVRITRIKRKQTKKKKKKKKKKRYIRLRYGMACITFIIFWESYALFHVWQVLKHQENWPVHFDHFSRYTSFATNLHVRQAITHLRRLIGATDSRSLGSQTSEFSLEWRQGVSLESVNE